ncbi:MAG: hypothetical protein CL424_15020 [Acidimicrobiaceae bacterium]|nr:hypothetical protein [Acidimicrobiaceae bacterium]
MARWVVVGGGAAGCVVAARLAARPETEVLLIESGHRFDAEPPAPGTDLGPYLTDPTRILPTEVVRRPGRPPEPYLQGHGLGGSSLVNGSIVTGVDPGGHALPLEEPWAHGPLSTALLAADPLARPVRLVRRNRRRVTVSDAYLDDAPPSLTVVVDEPVRRIRMHGRRAVGVEFAGGTCDADAVVVCAGALRTPALLLQSGISVPGLGEHLQDHPAFTLTVRLADGVAEPTVPTISAAATHDGYQVLPVEHLTAPGYGAVMVGLTRVFSQGRVTVDAAGTPVVELGQLADERDRVALAVGVEAAIALLSSSPFAATVERVFVDAAGTGVEHLVGRPERLRDWVVERAGGHYHVAGSCRDGVVTDAGRVRGYEGLFVADASVLPGVPPVDPYLEVVRQAERLVTDFSVI